jgi:16S rRNA (guanine527-N7)-methyltransferase
MLGEPPGALAVQQLLAYLDLLARWNRAYNLTAVSDPLEMVSRHLLDSLSVMPWLSGASLLDAGSGAGLPGVPLAIMRPALAVTLLDSAGKKIRFLRQVRRELGLENVYPVQQRLEAYVPAEPLACIVSRAFSSLGQFALAARHLLQPGVRMLAMKGQYPDEEIAGLPAWIQLQRVEKLSVPGLHEERHLVIMSLTA